MFWWIAAIFGVFILLCDTVWGDGHISFPMCYQKYLPNFYLGINFPDDIFYQILPRAFQICIISGVSDEQFRSYSSIYPQNHVKNGKSELTNLDLTIFMI